MNLKIFFLSAFFSFLLIISFISPAPAEWWQNPTLKEKLSLTDEQVKEMERIFTDFQKSRVDLQAELKKKQIDLKSLMAREELKEKKINKAVGDLSRTREKLFKEMVSMKLTIRKALTPEQIKLLLAEYPGIFSLERRWNSRNTRPLTVKKGNVIIKKEEEK